MNAYLDAMRNYATFSGRTSRSGYWLFVLILILIELVAAVLDVVLLGYAIEHGGPISGIVHLIHFIPALAIAVRRLHDIDRTGWWLLLYLTVIGGLVVLIFHILPGTRGANRFGRDPYPSAPA
ncbi:DUF805 domain-containing protein [Aquabacter spiritensis]|uniref:Uncharacterized membrane protein YhaH (DUF805 family) n=1 Tax=Aquabacter spiritensis TaxID=933073 RepID=A0A4R3LQX6_9HYPH|nr:DUF805 domain-containing protein [Aquabacter spiritensis]TCT02974.1 uncharacterized membrane protein YhaH (DUF805 family) [Aquabacter spiritensis]